MVLLPTPDDPSSAQVRPRRDVGADGVDAVAAPGIEHVHRHRPATAATSATAAGRSAHRSGLVSSTTGAAPLSRASSR